jgi:hypothetical protein
MLSPHDSKFARVLAITISIAAALGLALVIVAIPALAASASSSMTATPSPAGSEAKLAYVTGTASVRSTPTVWIARANGGQARRLGPGLAPVLAPNGQAVAASVAGSATGVQDKGPALVIYSIAGNSTTGANGTTGATTTTSYLNLAVATAQPLAWSPDSRYLAVALQSTAVNESGSGLAIIDTSTGTVTTIAKGQVQGASFAPEGSDRIVYGLAPSLETNASVNLYVAAPNGSGTQELTSDGRSLNPVWGPRWIAYDKERLRPNWAPRYDIWLRSAPSSSASIPASTSTSTSPPARKLTNVPANKLVSGLVPLAFSASGSRLLSEFEGQDTSAAWTVSVSSGRARQVKVRSNRSIVGAGISRDGSALLVDLGSFEGPPSSGSVATIPFAGGPAKVLVARGGQANWNR